MAVMDPVVSFHFPIITTSAGHAKKVQTHENGTTLRCEIESDVDAKMRREKNA